MGSRTSSMAGAGVDAPRVNLCPAAQHTGSPRLFYQNAWREMC